MGKEEIRFPEEIRNHITIQAEKLFPVKLEARGGWATELDVNEAARNNWIAGATFFMDRTGPLLETLTELFNACENKNYSTLLNTICPRIQTLVPNIRKLLNEYLVLDPASKIHSTIGVYANLDRKYNGVAAEHLADHIEYNKTMRPGRALFVDGKCIYKGALFPDQVKKIEQDLQDNPHNPTSITIPYQ